jgi:protein HIRA/HIR1
MDHLVLLTPDGRNVKKSAANFAPVSINPLLSSPNASLTSASVRPNGAPLLQLSSGTAHSYDAALQAFVVVADAWFAGGSDAWSARTSRGGASSAGARGPVAGAEVAVAEAGAGAGASVPRPEWWRAALTLGHLDGRLHAARALDSPAELKQALLVYAQRFAAEGFRAKAEELIRELHGPVYWRPGRSDGWCPTVAGLAKRDLLKEVLTIFGKCTVILWDSWSAQATAQQRVRHSQSSVRTGKRSHARPPQRNEHPSDWVCWYLLCC